MKINLKKKVINPRKYTPSPPPPDTLTVTEKKKIRVKLVKIASMANL